MNVVQIVAEGAEWACDQTDLHYKVKPLAEYLTEMSGAMTTEIMITVAKALELGIYLGKFGLPDERTPIPDVYLEEGG